MSKFLPLVGKLRIEELDIALVFIRVCFRSDRPTKIR